MRASASPTTVGKMEPDGAPPEFTMSSLPSELIEAIYERLPLPLLVRVASASHRFRNLAFEGCHPKVWSDKLDFYAAQYADRDDLRHGSDSSGTPTSGATGAAVRLRRVDDACFLALFEKLPHSARLNVRTIVLDYCEITRSAMDPILGLLQAPGAQLSRLSFVGCSRLCLAESELFSLVARPNFRVGIMGSYITSPADYSLELIALADGFSLSDGAGKTVELSRFDHAVGTWVNPTLLIPTCSVEGCRAGPLDSGGYIFDTAKNSCSRCGIRQHLCGDRWRCKGPGAGRCQRAGCGKRTSCAWCGDMGCVDHDQPADLIGAHLGTVAPKLCFG